MPGEQMTSVAAVRLASAARAIPESGPYRLPGIPSVRRSARP